MVKLNPITIKKDTKSGIYVYRYKATGNIVYVGKDQDLLNNCRHRYHLISKRLIPVERVLQVRPDDFIYQQFLYCHLDDLDMIEKILILFYLPEYNYEYKEQISKNHNATINFIKYLRDDYFLTKNDLKQLLLILNLRTLD